MVRQQGRCDEGVKRGKGERKSVKREGGKYGEEKDKGGEREKNEG